MFETLIYEKRDGKYAAPRTEARGIMGTVRLVA